MEEIILGSLPPVLVCSGTGLLIADGVSAIRKRRKRRKEDKVRVEDQRFVDQLRVPAATFDIEARCQSANDFWRRDCGELDNRGEGHERLVSLILRIVDGQTAPAFQTAGRYLLAGWRRVQHGNTVVLALPAESDLAVTSMLQLLAHDAANLWKGHIIEPIGDVVQNGQYATLFVGNGREDLRARAGVLSEHFQAMAKVMIDVQERTDEKVLPIDALFKRVFEALDARGLNVNLDRHVAYADPAKGPQWQVRVYVGPITSIFDNLLKNAEKHGHADKARIKVVTTAGSSGGQRWVHIYLIDNSFQPFEPDALAKFRAGKTQLRDDPAVIRQRGLGFGLRIVAALAELNRGYFTFFNVDPAFTDEEFRFDATTVGHCARLTLPIEG